MSWDRLSMAEKAEIMRLAVQDGIYNLDAIRNGYNEYAKGGKIHIKPENRGKFTALKERTGHSASWFKAHGTPAQKKMATFALNARKWKHGDGGVISPYDQPQTFAGRVAQVTGASPEVVRGADVVSSVTQMTPYGHFIGAMDLGRDLNRVYHGEEGAWWDSMIDAASMLPFLRQSGLKAEKTLYNTVRNNKTARRAINGAIGAGKAGDFISDTWGANKSSKAYGGELGNYYGGLGDFKNFLKKVYHGAKQLVGLEDTPEEASLKRGKERYKNNGYIGGEPRETRQKYFDLDRELTDSVNSISKRYGLNPSIVASRMAEEGPIDAAVREYNDEGNKGTKGLIISDNNKGTHGPLWGLDDFYSRNQEGRTKVTTTAPYSFKKRMFINEHGRRTESITSPQWWFGIEATAAEMKARRDQLKKSNPWMDNKTLDAATAMSFNYGETGVQEHIDKKKPIPQRFNPYIKTK